jgi:hypothetical protein
MRGPHTWLGRVSGRRIHFRYPYADLSWRCSKTPRTALAR